SVERLRSRLGISPDWSVLQAFLPALTEGTLLERRSAVASAFAASLELVKNGEIELRQDGECAPIYLRRREPQTQSGSDA
ncbi:MAG: segregation/condensation protein A, partial [Pseudomonadota bacterium]|nr:segregation/condensation protein A [Pseudomonadota bacterium]